MPDLRFTYKVEPDGAQFDRILRLRLGAIFDFRPVFEEVADLVYADIKTNFESGGKVAGGWQPLSKLYAAQKRRDFEAGRYFNGRRIQYTKIMYRTGALAESLIDRYDENAVFEITDSSLSIGTKIPYAQFHQTGDKAKKGRPPQRRLVALSEATRRSIVRVFQKESLKQGGFDGSDDVPF